jgi:hypothetical protein
LGLLKNHVWKNWVCWKTVRKAWSRWACWKTRRKQLWPFEKLLKQL